MKKRLIIIVIAVLMMGLFLTGCSSNKGAKNEAAPEKNEKASGEENKKPAGEEKKEFSLAGKTVTIYVPMAAGGGTDSSARLIADIIGDFLPGKPAVKVENMAGAGGAIAFNHLYQAADPNLSMGISTAGVFQRWLLREQGHNYDLSKMPVIGGVQGGRVFYISSASAKKNGIQTLDDLLKSKDKLTFGQTAVGGAHSLLLAALREEFGIPIQNIYGYKGMSEVNMAVMMGEVNGSVVAPETYLTSIVPMVQKGDVIPLFQTDVFENGKFVRDPRMPDIPTVMELYKAANKEFPGQYGELIKSLTLQILQGVVFFLPPGASADAVETYKEAMTAVLASDKFKNEAKARTGDEIVGISYKNINLDEMLFKVSPQVVEQFKSLSATESTKKK